METLIVPEKHDECTMEEMKGRKRKMSLANCDTCGTEEARYRCPGCSKHSCSLPCVKKHKSEFRCSGVRDNTAFVPLSKFDEMNLLSDYRFLEDTSRLADSAHRDPCALRPQTTKMAKVLRKRAYKFNLNLKLMPPGFSRRRENTTFYSTKAEQFFWHLKLLFPQSGVEYTKSRVPDQHTLEEILTPYIHPTESDPIRRQRLKAYVLAPPDHVKVFMKAENRRHNSLRYHELDLQKSLRDNLRFKVVIEYPVLHVALKGHWENYALLAEGSRREPTIGMAVKPPLPRDEHKEPVGMVARPLLPGDENKGPGVGMTTCPSMPGDESEGAKVTLEKKPSVHGEDGGAAQPHPGLVRTTAGTGRDGADDEMEEGEIRDDEEDD
ncbi:hypothetical protein AGOR_G00240940 [Albula goreensis]|uniref:Box C/D snoRNA protein 1 n=1 Tax=Albula goreensis TaxID=1534307 RepID=A0A8T3CGN1_9TELE|nr:hypothetical protein AGOR_G00240940 [Albula goreensis]